MSVMHKEMDKNDELRMEWDPFSDEQADGRFFPGAGRGERVEQLLQLLRYGPGLSLLVGPTGIGKRSLLVHLLTLIDRDLFDVAVLDAAATPDFARLLTQLDEPWRSMEPFTPDNFLELVPAVAAAADEESKTLVCILVGAQQLSVAVLDSLQAMLTASAGLPVKCLLLVDAAELEAVPVLSELMKGLPDTAVLYLDPLDQAQTGQYLHYRLQGAGLGTTSFNTQQVERIFHKSGGIITRINEAARELLLEAMPAAQKAPEKPPLPWVQIGGLAAAILIVLVLFSSGSDPDEPQPVTQTSSVVLDNPVQPLSEPATTHQPFAEVARMAAETAPPPAEPEPALSDVATEAGTGYGPGAGQSAPAGIEMVPPVPAQAGTPVVENKPSVAPAEVQRPAPVTRPAPVVSRPATSASKPAASKPVAAAQPAANGARAGRVLALPQDHYVLQLLGAQEEATVKRFLNQYPSLRKVTYYKTWRQGKPWFVVVQGDYPSYAAAKSAVATLPAALQKQTPWIRQVSAVTKEIPR